MTAVATKVPAWADHDVAELAPMLTVRQLQRLLGKYDFTGIAEPDSTEPGITERHPTGITEPDDNDAATDAARSRSIARSTDQRICPTSRSAHRSRNTTDHRSRSL